ncbi:Cullin-1-like protein [Drosera capensis]
MGQMEYYENDFEADMLKDTAAYYSRKASNWILEDSCPDYFMKKVQHELLLTRFKISRECIGSFQKYLKAWTLFLLYLSRWCQKLITFFFTLCFVYFLLRFALVNVQHVTAEGTALVKQAEDAATNKKVTITRHTVLSPGVLSLKIVVFLA